MRGLAYKREMRKKRMAAVIRKMDYENRQFYEWHQKDYQDENGDTMPYQEFLEKVPYMRERLQKVGKYNKKNVDAGIRSKKYRWYFFSYYSIGERKNAEKALFDLKENEIQGAYTRIHQIVHDDGHGRLNFGSPTVASDKACDYDAFRNLITEKKLECF